MLIVVAILVILASAAASRYFRYLEDARVGRAKGEMRVIERPSRSTTRKTGTFPETGPDSADRVILEQGQQGLIDPWGNPYGYSVDSQQDSESVDGGIRVKVYVICNGPPGRAPFNVPDQNTGR